MVTLLRDWNTFLDYFGVDTGYESSSSFHIFFEEKKVKEEGGGTLFAYPSYVPTAFLFALKVVLYGVLYILI